MFSAAADRVWNGERIAELLQDSRLEGSYVPRTEVRVLRDLTSYRVKLVEYQCSVVLAERDELDLQMVEWWRRRELNFLAAVKTGNLLNL
jgi:hypothetical protein